MNKTVKNILKEILKGLIYAVLGTILGMVLVSSLNVIARVLCILGILCIMVLTAVVYVLFFQTREDAARPRVYGQEQSARVSRNNDASRLQQQRPETPVTQQKIQENPLDRKPISAEKKEQRERNRTRATKVVLLNEEGRALMEWNLDRQTSFIIGKGSEKEPVDIDLSGSAVAQMISKQHAVLNYTEKGWYVDDIDSKNGTRVKKSSQNSIMDVKLVGAIEVEPGDIIYIASTMLQIQ